MNHPSLYELVAREQQRDVLRQAAHVQLLRQLRPQPRSANLLRLMFRRISNLRAFKKPVVATPQNILEPCC